MKINILSDLHMDHYRTRPEVGLVTPNPDADVIILAGDIEIGEEAIKYARDFAQLHGKPVLYVPGNHEYYHGDHEVLWNMYATASTDGVHVLMDSEVTIGDVRFCGGTLWTDFALYEPSVRFPTRKNVMDMVNSRFSDFKHINNGEHSFTAQQAAILHAKTRRFIDSVLDTPFDGKTVVVTHHSPHPNGIPPKYVPERRFLDSPFALPNEKSDWMFNPCFSSNLTSTIEKADYWFHAHVHHPLDYPVGKCRVIANPRGYRMKDLNGERFWENRSFDPMMLVDV